MTITMIPTAMRGVSTARLVNHDMTPATDAERDLLDLVPEGPVDLRSTAQIELMNRLMVELRDLDADTARQGDEYMHRMTMGGHWTPGRDGNASRWIDRLISKSRELRAARRPAAGTARVELADGVYRLDGQLYMVQHAVHGSGNQYAKRILVEQHIEGQRVPTEYARGIITKLTPEMALSAEEVKAYGDIYGECVYCHRPLTDERSKAAGCGETCADKHGIAWG